MLNSDKSMVKKGSFVLLGIFIIVLFFSSFTTVKSGEVGLKVRFGKIVDTQINEGINFKIPFVEKIIRVDVKVQKQEDKVESSTKDMQTINTTTVVNYHVDSTKAPALYKKVGEEYANTVLKPAIKEALKNSIAQYNAEEITLNRSKVSEECLTAIQTKVEKYGIIIDDFNLTDFGFSEEYSKAIEEKQVAEQNLEKAKLDAEAKVVKAQGERDANILLEESLTKEILMEKFIEKWNGELPKVSGGNNIFDISELLK